MSHRTGLFGGVVSLLLALSGLALLGGGAWLVSLHGSWYYLLAGIVLLVDAWLLWRARASSMWLFAALLLVTLAWALWESGLDWWPLAARLDVLFVLGVLLLVVSALHVFDRPARGGTIALWGVMLAVVVASAASWLHDPHDLAGTLAAAGSAAPGAGEPTRTDAAADWTAYGGTGFGDRYSSLRDITPANVTNLQEVWHFHTGDVRGRRGDPEETTYEVTPLKIGNRLFLCTPHQNVIALDATTGAQLWRYVPKMRGGLALQHLTCRGLSWQPATGAAGTAAPQPTAVAAQPPAAASSSPQSRQPLGTGPSVDAQSPHGGGTPGAVPVPTSTELPVAAADGPNDATCASKLFMATADGRLIALNPDTGHVCSSFGGGTGQVNLWLGMPNFDPGSYYSTSPVVVTSKLVVVGGTVLDNVSVHEQSGVIRAYDIDTGKLVWNWDSGNPEQTAPLAPGQTYVVNSPNSWSTSAVDEKLGLVYVPMGNQPPDQWGGKRSPAVEKYSSSIVALDLATGKVRWSFQTVHHDLWDYDVPSQPSLLDLRVGGQDVPVLVQPTKQGELFVLDRRTGKPVLPVSEHDAPQGAAQGDHSAPTQPRSAISFDPRPLTGRDMWGTTMFDQLYCRVAFHKLRYEGRFTPPSLGGSLIFPGNFGVFNWGSIAVDPVHGWAFTTPAYLAFVSQLVPRPNDTALVLEGGKRPKGSLPALNENFGAPYAVKLNAFISPLGIPCHQPPWGYVAGIDLASGKIAWQHRNGTVRDLSPIPLPFRMGVPSLGGPVVTAGGVAFYSGTLDYYLRAYDEATGRELWRTRLPAGAQATPMTYKAADGRQFVVVVAGGHGSTGTKPGDDVIAYALAR